jgi:hypothetical protein
LGYADSRRRQIFAVKLGRVVQNGLNTATPDIVTDSLHNFARTERFSEQIDRALASCFGHNIASRTQFIAQVAEQLLCVALTAIDSFYGK